ncbi:MAG: hypothetical protein KKD77_21185 [Gammaproteobacteria bacterium]|nr:hypothetical protein [Gammaproteobacteria bacterium]
MKKLILSIFLVISLAITSFAAEPFFTDVIVTSPNGIWTDARAYSTLNDAVAAVGANERTIVIASPQVVTTLTIPSTITLKFERNGSITNSGNLDIQTKNIIADNRQIFTGVGNIDFAAGSTVKTGWFSNIESAFALTTNDTVTLEISKPATITANYSPNVNVNLKWTSPGNVLTVTAGTTLSNLKNIEAGNFQIFGTTGDVDFVAGAKVKSGWFANIESAFTLTSDDTVTLLITKPQTITASSPGNNVNLSWDSPGNILTISSGITVTVNGVIQADRYQIFSFADATARLVYDIREVFPEWVGNTDSIFYPDYNATDQGDTGNNNTIKYAIDTIGVDDGTIVLRHNSGTAITTYTVSTSETIGSTIQLVIEKGARLSIDVGQTLILYSPANINAAPNQQIFTGAGTVAFTIPGTAYLHWWPVNADATTDDQAILTAAILSLPDGSTLEMGYGYGYAIASAWTIASRNHLTINFNGSYLKRTGAAGLGMVVDQSSHITLNDPIIDGNDIATDGLLFYSSAGTSTNFCVINNPIVYNSTRAGIRFGYYAVDGFDYAVDRIEINNARIYQNLYNVMLDSTNALHIAFYRASLSKTNVNTATSPLYDVYISRGGAFFYDLYTVGAMRDDNDSWAFYIHDGYAKVYGGYGENALGSGNAGYVLMVDRTNAIRADQQSEFYGFNMAGAGASVADPTAVGNEMILIMNDANPLLLEGCNVSKNTYSGVNEVLVRVGSGGNFTSINNYYGGSPNVPWRGLTNGGIIGRVISLGDKSTQDYTTLYNVPSYNYDSLPVVDMTDHATSGTGEDDLASTTFAEYFLGNRSGLRISASGLVTGANNTKTIKVHFGTWSSAIMAQAAGDQNNWEVEIIVFNTTAATQRIWYKSMEADGTFGAAYANLTVNTALPLTVKLTGECVNAGDTITQKMWMIERLN